MLVRWIRPLRFLVQGIATSDTPRQLALGLALGMVIGLVPKGNLTALVLSTILIATRVNLATGMLGVFVFSLLSGWTDPLANRLGHSLLSIGPLQPVYAYLFDLPLAAWTSLDNTVVFGSLVLGIWLFWPVYHFSYLGVEKARPWIGEQLQRYRVADVLDRSEFAARWRSQ